MNFEDDLYLHCASGKETKAMFVFVFDSTEKRIIASHTKGSFTKEQFEEAVELSKEGCEDRFTYYKKVLES